MALRAKGLIFRAEVAGSLLITPRAGEGIRIMGIYVSNISAALAHLTVINDTARVGFFRVAGLGGGHLGNPRNLEQDQTARFTNLIELMKATFAFPGYPVVQGETLTLSIDTGTADIFAFGDSFDIADVVSTQPQGSKSQDVTFVNYGTNNLALAVTAYTKLDTTRNPKEMVQFPFGTPGAGLVPAGKRVTILYIGGQPVGRFVAAGATAQSQYIRPRVGTAPAQTILDRNDVGFPFFGTIPGAGVDYTSVRSAFPAAPVFWNPTFTPVPEIGFGPNDEFALQVQTTVVGAGQLNVNDVDLWAIERVFPVGG